MGTTEPRWFYVGDGLLRLKDGDEWTDQCEKIEKTRARATEFTETSEAVSAEPLPAIAEQGRVVAWLALCTALVVVGGTGAAFATGALKPAELTSFLSESLSGSASASDQTSLEASSGWDGGGFTKADYLKRVGDISVWVSHVRGDVGSEQATRVDMLGLAAQFDAIRKLPAPPRVDPGWWATNTKSLSTLSRQAAGEWAAGDKKASMARYQAVVKRSNTLISKVNAAFGLDLRLSETVA